MRHISVTLVICTAALAGCDQPGRDQASRYEAAGGAPTAAAPADATAVQGLAAQDSFRFSGGGTLAKSSGSIMPQSGEAYVYDHNLTVSMASNNVPERSFAELQDYVGFIRTPGRSRRTAPGCPSDSRPAA
jgi:hypothetical protein